MQPKFYQFKIWRLMLAMAAHEGWAPPDQAQKYDGSASYRNHNPGNLRSSPFQCGTHNGFAIFINDWVGFNAMQWDIMQKAQGKTSTGLGPNSTIADFLRVWAPPSDNNDTQAYIDRVASLSGLPATTTLGSILEQ